MKIILIATYLIAFASFIGGFRAPHQWFITASCMVLLIADKQSKRKFNGNREHKD